MASTPYKDTGARLYLSGYTFTINGRVNYSNITRSNNTVTFHNVTATAQYGGPSGGSFYWGNGWDILAQVPSGTNRSSGYWSGSRNVGNTNTTGAQTFSFSVGANDTSVNVRNAGKFRNDGWTYTSNTSVSIPALGSPAGTTYYNSSTDKSINVRNDVTSWGSNATAGSVRSYRADNSSFSGQTYINASDNSNVNHTGLTPNKQYWFRGWASNGGGKTSYMSTINRVTLANASETSKEVLATSASITVAATQGVRTTNTFVQYRKVGDTTWTSTGSQTGATPTIEITDLVPSTNYEYRICVTTVEGTWQGTVSSLTSLPAGKLVYPNGDVKNGLPRIILPDGTVKMVQLSQIGL